MKKLRNGCGILSLMCVSLALGLLAAPRVMLEQSQSPAQATIQAHMSVLSSTVVLDEYLDDVSQGQLSAAQLMNTNLLAQRQISTGLFEDYVMLVASGAKNTTFTAQHLLAIQWATDSYGCYLVRMSREAANVAWAIDEVAAVELSQCDL